jgi:hypothetical protein
MTAEGPPVTSWFRSADMQYVSLIVQGHVAHDTLEALGDLGAISFHDLNPDLTPFQRRFTKHIRRCDELERVIRYFEDEMTKYEVKPQVRGKCTACVTVHDVRMARSCGARGHGSGGGDASAGLGTGHWAGGWLSRLVPLLCRARGRRRPPPCQGSGRWCPRGPATVSCMRIIALCGRECGGGGAGVLGRVAGGWLACVPTAAVVAVFFWRRKPLLSPACAHSPRCLFHAPLAPTLALFFA